MGLGFENSNVIKFGFSMPMVSKRYYIQWNKLSLITSL